MSAEDALYRWRELTAKSWTWAWICSNRASADKLQALLGDPVKPNGGAGGQPYVALALGESGEHTDLAPLVGREMCVLMPDATVEAAKHMQAVAERVRGLCRRVRLVATGEDPFGWSPDWQGSLEELQAYAQARITELPAPQGGASLAHPPSSRVSPPTPAGAGTPDDDDLPPLDAYDGEAPEEIIPQALSEDAIADRFAEIHAEKWRFVEAWKRWFSWDGDGWAEDRVSERIDPMRQLYRAACESREAQALSPEGKRRLCRLATIGQTMRLAGTDKRLRSIPEIWDADPWMLGVPGGVLDLREGKLIEAVREQYITRRTLIAPELGKPALWLEMLKRWHGGDEDVIGFLRRFFGYSMTGDAREQCMAFFYGPGQSGKGTILRALAGILGSAPENRFRSYHYEAPISTFLESKNEAHPTRIAALHGSRLITSEEPSAGSRWDEGTIKWITGGSLITARMIAKDYFSFTMTGKIIVAANHRPRLGTTDKAIRRRLHVVPFEHPVSDEDRDNTLDARLREEWPRILNWLIEGCLEWQQCGLGLPERISASTDEYLEAEDTLGAWLAECCDQEGKTEGKALYDNYQRWCEINGEHAYTRKGWGSALAERGFKPGKGTHGVRVIVGLSLKLGAGLP